MKKLPYSCLMLMLVGCGEQRQEPTQVALQNTRRFTPAPAPKVVARTTHTRPTKKESPPPEYDKEDPPERPIAKLSPQLKREVDAYLDEPPITITAPKLIKGYQDEKKGDNEYKGRKVWITGYVLRTDLGTVGYPNVDLEAGKNQAGAVHCIFEKGYGEDVGGLKEGQEVTVEGRVDAKSGSEIRLSECRLLTPEFIQAVTSAARQQKGN